MQKSSETLKTLESLMIKYETNKTKVPEADLKGKYAVAFQNLKDDLKKALEEYAKARVVEALPEANAQIDVANELAREITIDYKKFGLDKKISRLAFKEFDLQGIINVTEEAQERIKALWNKFYLQHKEAIRLKNVKGVSVS